MEQPKEQLTLLEWMVEHSKRQNISDLKYLSPLEKAELANLIDYRVKAEDYSLFTWNDAINYLLGEATKDSQEHAKAFLILKMRE